MKRWATITCKRGIFEYFRYLEHETLSFFFLIFLTPRHFRHRGGLCAHTRKNNLFSNKRYLPDGEVNPITKALVTNCPPNYNQTPIQNQSHGAKHQQQFFSTIKKIQTRTGRNLQPETTSNQKASTAENLTAANPESNQQPSDIPTAEIK